MLSSYCSCEVREVCSCSYGLNRWRFYRIQPFRLQTRQGRELAQEDRPRQGPACLRNRSAEKRKVAHAARERQGQACCPERRTANQCSISQAIGLKKMADTKAIVIRVVIRGRAGWAVTNSRRTGGCLTHNALPLLWATFLPFSLPQDSIRQNCDCCIMSTWLTSVPLAI